MKVKRLISRLSELNPDATVVVIVAGHSVDVYDVDEGVTSRSNPDGWADILLLEDQRPEHNNCADRSGR